MLGFLLLLPCPVSGVRCKTRKNLYIDLFLQVSKAPWENVCSHIASEDFTSILATQGKGCVLSLLSAEKQISTHSLFHLSVYILLQPCLKHVLSSQFFFLQCVIFLSAFYLLNHSFFHHQVLPTILADRQEYDRLKSIS